MSLVKSTKHNGWHFGIIYNVGQKGKYMSVMFYKWAWIFSIGD